MLEDEAQYVITVDPHAKFTVEDIFEAIETNFIGALDELKLE